MANRFWVGGGSANTWAATANTNWATTSGGANNASVPGVSDVAIFDSNSGVGNSVIGANITVQGLDCTGGTGNYAGTITHNSSVTLTINTGAASSVRFSAGMTYTAAATTSLVTLTHTSGTANITSNGQRFGALTINGAGGTTQLLDALRVDVVANSTLTVTSGIFDANGGAGGPFAITACAIAFSGSTTRSVILGGLVKIGGNVGNTTTIWNAATTTALTFTKNSANIEIVAQAIASSGITFAGGGLTYNNLTIDANSSPTSISFTGGNMTLANLTVGAGWTLLIANNVTHTINNAFTMTGTQSAPIGVICVGPNGSTLSVASGACTLTWGALSGIVGTGGATFTATNTLNLGSNTGWAISAPADSTLAAPTAAQVATAVWQDVTTGDFTLANSVGKSVMNGVALGTGLTINAYTGNTVQTGDAYARIGANGAGLTAIPTIARVTLVDTLTTYTGNTVQTGDAYARIGAAGAGLTAIPTVARVTLVDTVTTLTNLPAIPAGWITAAGIAASALDNKGNWMISYTQPAGFLAATFPSGTIANTTNITAGTITNATNLTNAPTAGDFTTAMKTSLNAATPASVTGAVGSVTGSVGSVASYGTLVADVATAVWAAGTRSLTTFGTVVADVATAVWAAGTRILTAGTNIVLAKGTGITGFNDIAAGAAMTLTGAYDAAKTAAQAGDAMALTTPIGNALVAATAAQVTADHGSGSYIRNTEPVSVDDILRNALTEGYAANGAAPTLEQATFAMLSMLAGAKKAIVGTTLTIYKLDGTTPAMTFTLDSGTSPTSQARAT